ncbi:MAG TPA: hypothetical protein DHU65_02030 [Clostridiales bacterium]|nr:hypothetical protein [Clostridiales bacterium]
MFICVYFFFCTADGRTGYFTEITAISTSIYTSRRLQCGMPEFYGYILSRNAYRLHPYKRIKIKTAVLLFCFFKKLC